MKKSSHKNSFSADLLGRKTVFKEINKADVAEMHIIINRLNALGIETGVSFSSTNDRLKSSDNSDEHIAKMCVYSGKAIPEDVEQRLLDKLYKKHNIKRQSAEIEKLKRQ